MGTFAFQRALPVTAWRVFAAKIGLAVVGGALLVAALTGLTWLLFVPERPPWTEAAWLPGLLAVAEVFAWGVFFSLVLRQPLWAALLGMSVPLFAVYAARPVGLKRRCRTTPRIFRRTACSAWCCWPSTPDWLSCGSAASWTSYAGGSGGRHTVRNMSPPWNRCCRTMAGGASAGGGCCGSSGTKDVGSRERACCCTACP